MKIERILRVWVLRQIPQDFKAGASCRTIASRYGVTATVIEHAIRIALPRSHARRR